jgi:hypothetical protein
MFGMKYMAAPHIALRVAHNTHNPVSAQEFLLTDGIRNCCMMGAALCFLLTVIGFKGKKFSGYTDSRCAEWLVNKAYWSGGFSMFFLVMTAYLTYGNM